MAISPASSLRLVPEVACPGRTMSVGESGTEKVTPHLDNLEGDKVDSWWDEFVKFVEDAPEVEAGI